MCPEDFNADALLHVSVSVKRIFLFYFIFTVPTYFWYYLQENA